MTTLRPRFVRGGYKFTGRHAKRNMYVYGLFRLGAKIDDLARTCRLTPGRIRQIIGEGNRGSLPRQATGPLRNSSEG
jgi:hypothetical protein